MPTRKNPFGVLPITRGHVKYEHNKDMNIQDQGYYNNDVIEVKSSKIIKKWGWEEVLINNNNFCGKILHYNNLGSLSSYHFHNEKKEYFRCTNGSFIFRYKNNEGKNFETIMKKDDSIYIPNCRPHQLESLEDNSEILEISTPHRDSDVVRIEPGDSQK